MSSNSIEFLKSKTFFRNLIILFLILVVVFFSLTLLLNKYTLHGENISVPELRGLKISKLEKILITHNFHYKVVDSLYEVEKEPGTILDQDPAPNSKVKVNRTIYLTVNATQPPDVKMPDLVDVSFRQAEAMLQSFGLIIGDVVYRSDLAKNAVLEQLYKNRNKKPGTMIPKGAVIDLVLGDGLGDIEVPVPNLIGLTLNEAMLVIRKASLSIGHVQFDGGNSDTLNAKIYSQKPSSEDGIMLRQGDSVDINLH